ncbi:MAG: hypothetical protein M0D55_08645 [Elusimicrobiota bacterium]|nr:MAG: hypothetical protein M0D55_08645 [Elusimicrobiota bacterium]
MAGRPAEAASDLERYALLDGAPWSGWSRYELGLSLAALGAPAAARLLEEALERGVASEGGLGPAFLTLAPYDPKTDLRELLK